MESPKIDFTRAEQPHDNRTEDETVKTRRPRRRFRRFWIVFILVLAVSLSVQISHIQEQEKDTADFSVFGTLKQLVQSGDRTLIGETTDRINILILGVGGEGHDGPELADTILLASFQPSTQDVALVSIPRDLTVPIPGYGWRKVNHANAFGAQEGYGEGPKLARDVLEKILDIEIPYYVRVDFDGFATLIDDLGGVDVYIEKAFSDSQYPTHGMEYADCNETPSEEKNTNFFSFLTDTDGEEPAGDNSSPYGCRYETLTFQSGWTKMDGNLALKFVRSRHGTNGEGSDFARSRRQQQVLLAIKEKMLKASVLLNPSKINRIQKTLENNIVTNIETWEVIRLAKLMKDIDREKIKTVVLDASPTSPLYAATMNGAYVLLPKNDDWRPLQKLVANVFSAPGQEALPDKNELVNIEIQNGTKISGLAFRVSQLLNGQGFDVTQIGNAEEREYHHTVIYDLTNGQHSEALKDLQRFLEADVTLSATGWLLAGDVVPRELTISREDYVSLAQDKDVDFLIILGENSANLASN